jgi:hypothetical protein
MSGVILQAPFDLIQATVFLPSAKLSDSTAPQIKVQIRNSMSGVIYSTVKTNSRLKFQWTFELTHAKARELLNFNEYYNSLKWRVTDWNANVYYMNCLTSPLEVTPVSLSTSVVHLELDGTQIL